jgi:hypothetical protein
LLLCNTWPHAVGRVEERYNCVSIFSFQGTDSLLNGVCKVQRLQFTLDVDRVEVGILRESLLDMV